MATTRYRIAATPSNDEKIVSSLKAARVEADNRAKLDRVDVEVTTVATGKLAYTARGAIAAPAPAPEPEAPAAPAADTTPAADEDSEGTEDSAAFDGEAFEAELAELLSDAAATMATADDDEDEDEDGSQDDEEDSADDKEPAAADDADSDASDDEEPAAADRGLADCGCPIDKIIENGTHGEGCTDAPKAEAAAEAVKRDQPARPARRTGGGARPTQGPSVVDGWDLLYDKPRQDAQVGKSPEGKYALICTKHKHAHPLQRLTQERGLRGGSRSVWCPNC